MASDACRCLMAAGICQYQIYALKQSQNDGLAERFVLMKSVLSRLEFLIPIKWENIYFWSLCSCNGCMYSKICMFFRMSYLVIKSVLTLETLFWCIWSQRQPVWIFQKWHDILMNYDQLCITSVLSFKIIENCLFS